MNITKPNKIQLSPALAVQWQPGAMLYLRKYDGEFSTMTLPEGTVLLGEKMTRKSGGLYTPEDESMFLRHGSWFAAWDIVQFDGEDVSQEPGAYRWGMLSKVVPRAHSEAAPVILAENYHDGYAALLDILEVGGEGVVARGWQDPYGEIQAAKRLQTFRVVVTGFVPNSQSVTVADAETGEPRGAVTLRGGKCDKVRVGSVLKVEGMGLTEAGKIREPRPCSDAPGSWLVKA